MLPVNNTALCLSVILAMFLSTAVSADVATLENDLTRVDVDRASGWPDENVRIWEDWAFWDQLKLLRILTLDLGGTTDGLRQWLKGDG